MAVTMAGKSQKVAVPWISHTHHGATLHEGLSGVSFVHSFEPARNLCLTSGHVHKLKVFQVAC